MAVKMKIQGDLELGNTLPTTLWFFKVFLWRWWFVYRVPLLMQERRRNRFRDHLTESIFVPTLNLHSSGHWVHGIQSPFLLGRIPIGYVVVGSHVALVIPWQAGGMPTLSRPDVPMQDFASCMNATKMQAQLGIPSQQWCAESVTVASPEGLVRDTGGIIPPIWVFEVFSSLVLLVSLSARADAQWICFSEPVPEVKMLKYFFSHQ